MELVKDDIQPYEEKIVIIPFYENGICHVCNSPVEYKDKIWAVTVQNQERWSVFMPLTMLKCPWCNSLIKTILIWKDLDITEELAKLEKEIE